ncbi:DNL zinc finger-domain-containing protein [Filobasidium floriforme]|uniref:DNL zinc finger-domain-containing protein n=1 Tax=Filobasidium floriforme TaxID=5210 RepID=UPI001E8EC2AB|nr:DNL zinc finger-domain-containing protein [Filobasidium floriforme]KAH8079702.1 DNL zinc finger-domain-containing protein [Filobasidium floriforme]
MSLRPSAHGLVPFLKQALRPQPLASTSRLPIRPALPLAPSSSTTSLPYAQFARRFKSTSTPTTAESNTEEGTSTNLKFVDENGNPLRIEPKLSLTFTCSVDKCGERSTHEFAKRSYTKGIVIVQCPGCKNRHLIADHLGWFKEVTEEGRHRTIEDLMKAKGEKVTRGKVGQDGDIEIID